MRNEEWKCQKPNSVPDRSYAFALRVIELYKFLCGNGNVFLLLR